MRSKVSLVVTHIVICLGFLLLPYIFNPGGINIRLTSEHDRNVFLSYCLILSFSYLHYFVIIPKFYFTKRYVMYWSFLVIICLTIVNIPELLMKLSNSPYHNLTGKELSEKNRQASLPPERGDRGPGGPPPYTYGIFISAIGLFLTLYIRVNNQWKINERKKLYAELSTLKLQVNPHFLFNTLNSIYALSIREKGKMTADSILKLSGIMRYVVSETRKHFVPLSNELSYLSDYVSLQRIRLGANIKFEYVVNGDADDLKICPLILITFIENAFKYGVNPDESSDIFVQIDIRENKLTLQVRNIKVKINSSESLSSGVGIENTRARLDFYYPERYELNIKDEGKYYEVLLRISLAEIKEPQAK